MHHETCPSGPNTAETPQQFLERIFCEIPHSDVMFLMAPAGEIIAHASNDDKICKGLPALAGELLRLGKQAAEAMRQGSSQHLLLKNEGGYMMMVALESGHIFVVLGREHIRPDVIQYSADWVANKLSALLSITNPSTQGG